MDKKSSRAPIQGQSILLKAVINKRIKFESRIKKKEAFTQDEAWMMQEILDLFGYLEAFIQNMPVKPLEN